MHAEAIDASSDDQAATRPIGQFDLFGGLPARASDGPPTGLELAASRSASGTRPSCSAFEREMLGLYVSDHPLFGVEHVLRGGGRLLDRRAADDEDVTDGQIVIDRRALSGRAAQDDQAGQRLGHRAVEDLEGAIEVMFFPQTYQLVSPRPAHRGRRRRRQGPGRQARGRRHASSRWRSPARPEP